ncbi:YfhO family protein [bacterium]|nr:YfhO family protein [bacterium]
MKKTKFFLLKIIGFYKRHEYLRVFSFIWLISFLILGFFALGNGLALPINGDYSLQQLHFYVEGRNAFWTLITTGEFKMWSYQGFLGYNYFAANTFYYLTSPFSFPIYLLPPILVPQGIFIMMTIKLATAGLLMYILFKKFFKTRATTALIGACAYAFCGWGFFYLWFNHFHDVLAVLPLTLIGVEYCLQKRKGYFLGLALFICGLVNYFFLFTFVFSTLAYGIFRYFQCFRQNKGFNLNILFQAFVFSLLGVGACAFIIFPAFNIVGTLSRVEYSTSALTFLRFFFVNPVKTADGYLLGELKSLSAFFKGSNLNALLKFIFVFDKPNPTRYVFYPLVEFVFPEVGCWENLLFSSSYYDNTYSSLYITLPLLLLTWTRLFLAFKEKRPSHIIATILLCVSPFIPFFYLLFGGFSSVLYGRWLIVIVIFILVSTIPVIDRLTEIPRHYFDYALFITLVIQSVTIALAAKQGAFTADNLHIAYIFVIIIFTFVNYYILKEVFCKESFWINQKVGEIRVEKLLLIFVVLDILLTATVSVNVQGVQNYWNMYGGQNLLNEQRALVSSLNKEDPSFYRLFNSTADRNANNLALTLNYKGLGSFHSVNNSELTTFIQDWTRASYTYGNWSMGIDEKRYNLDSFLNVKYYLLKKDDLNVPLGFSLFKESEHFALYKNDYHCELGYSFDTAIANKNFHASEHFMREAFLNEVAVVQDADLPLVKESLGDDLKVVSHLFSDFKRVPLPNGGLKSKARESEEWVSLSSIYALKGALDPARQDKLYGPWKDRGLSGDQIKIEFPETNRIGKNAEEIGGYHLIVKLCYGPNVKISLYNNDELVSEDAHGINNYDHENDHKFARGFYLRKSVNKIVLELLGDANVSTFTKFGLALWEEPFTKYQARMTKRAAFPLQDIRHRNNSLDFTTNYPNKRLVVLSVPYDKGWNLKIDGEEQSLLKLDSGFLGFVAESGKHDYHLQYTTPNLIKGVKVSIVCIFAGFVLSAIIIVKEKKMKKKEEEN